MKPVVQFTLILCFTTVVTVLKGKPTTEMTSNAEANLSQPKEESNPTKLAKIGLVKSDDKLKVVQPKSVEQSKTKKQYAKAKNQHAKTKKHYAKTKKHYAKAKKQYSKAKKQYSKAKTAVKAKSFAKSKPNKSPVKESPIARSKPSSTDQLKHNLESKTEKSALEVNQTGLNAKSEQSVPVSKSALKSKSVKSIAMSKRTKPLAKSKPFEKVSESKPVVEERLFRSVAKSASKSGTRSKAEMKLSSKSVEPSVRSKLGKAAKKLKPIKRSKKSGESKASKPIEGSNNIKPVANTDVTEGSKVFENSKIDENSKIVENSKIAENIKMAENSNLDKNSKQIPVRRSKLIKSVKKLKSTKPIKRSKVKKSTGNKKIKAFTRSKIAREIGNTKPSKPLAKSRPNKSKLSPVSSVKSDDDAVESMLLPSLASITYIKVHICSGSIINKHFILTAAHCLYDGLNVLLPKENMLVVVEVYEKNDGVSYEVNGIHTHEWFDNQTYANDVGLIKTTKPILMGQGVAKISLRSAEVSDETTVGTTSWYGVPKFDNYSSDETFNIASVQSVPIDFCKKTFLSVSRRHICMNSVSTQGDCNEDSGGPLVIVKNDTIEQIGILSFNINCDPAKPVVYTRISWYYNWITNRTENVK